MFTITLLPYHRQWFFAITCRILQITLYSFYNDGFVDSWGGIFKLLWSPEIDSKEIDSASLCNLTGRHENPSPTWFLVPIYCSKISAQHRQLPLEIHNKRQATRHDCLSNWLGYGGQTKWNSVRVRKKIFGTGPTRAAKVGQKFLVLASQAQRTLSYIHHESPCLKFQQ